jgi:antitoxin MazE
VLTKVQKWGNSLGLRIPKSFAEEAGVEEGSAVDLTIERGSLVIRPGRRRYSFRSLVRGITEENLHEPIDDGGPVGRELL